jgi:hypothetical protein
MRVRAAAWGFSSRFQLPAWRTAQTPQVIPPRAPTIADAKPDAQGVRRMAVFRGLDKITGRARDVEAPVGVPVKFGTLTLTVQTCHTVPPEEPPETTAFVQIDENLPGAKPKRMFSGWMFASTPALNALEHPTYDVWVTNCKTDEPVLLQTAAPAAPAKSPRAAPAKLLRLQRLRHRLLRHGQPLRMPPSPPPPENP